MFDSICLKQIFDKTREYLMKNDHELKSKVAEYKKKLEIWQNNKCPSYYDAKVAEINNEIIKEIAYKGMFIEHKKLESLQNSLTNILKCSICLEKVKHPLQVGFII